MEEKDEKKEDKVERLPALRIAEALAKEASLFFVPAKFEHAQRVAKILSESTMVPEHFRGKVGNCMIALNLADRMGIDPFLLMQNIYVVKGRPGIEAKLAITLLEGAGKFGPLHYKFEGSGVTGKKVKRPNSCAAYAVDLRTKETVYGPIVTWEMVEAEGWNKPRQYRDGGGEMPSKWETMPELMFMYRAATFFARVHSPGALLGMRTADELEDIFPAEIAVEGPKKEDPEPMPALPEREGADPAEVEKFIDLSVQNLGSKYTKKDLIESAKNNPDNFWKGFLAWKKKQGPAPENKKKNGNGGAKCPETQKVIEADVCASCSMKEGCPGV